MLESKQVSWFLDFWFLGFKDPWFLIFRVSRFLGFKHSKNPSMILNDIWSILPIFHFMFLIDIDLISKIIKILLDGPSGFSGARLFGNCQHVGFPTF